MKKQRQTNLLFVGLLVLMLPLMSSFLPPKENQEAATESHQGIRLGMTRSSIEELKDYSVSWCEGGNPQTTGTYEDLDGNLVIVNFGADNKAISILD
jgi:hypothetical protein